jgi:hypothetical protein
MVGKFVALPFLRSSGAWSNSLLSTPGLRPGLYSGAASRLTGAQAAGAASPLNFFPASSS